MRCSASSLFRDIVIFSVEVELERVEYFPLDSLQDCVVRRDWGCSVTCCWRRWGQGEEALVLEDVEI